MNETFLRCHVQYNVFVMDFAENTVLVPLFIMRNRVYIEILIFIYLISSMDKFHGFIVTLSLTLKLYS